MAAREQCNFKLEVRTEIGALSQIPIMSAVPSARFNRKVLLGAKLSTEVEAARRILEIVQQLTML